MKKLKKIIKTSLYKALPTLIKTLIKVLGHIIITILIE